MGRISRSILIALFLLCLFLVFVAGSIYLAIFFRIPLGPGQNGTYMWILLLLDMLLFSMFWAWLAKKWPGVFSEGAFKEGGPALTAGRAVVGLVITLLWASTFAIVPSMVGLKTWQIVALLAIPFAVFLSIVNALERRWLKADSQREDATRHTNQ